MAAREGGQGEPVRGGGEQRCCPADGNLNKTAIGAPNTDRTCPSRVLDSVENEVDSLTLRLETVAQLARHRHRKQLGGRHFRKQIAKSGGQARGVLPELERL